MKWPCKLILIRHDKSAYNELKKQKEKELLYQRFLAAWRSNPESKETVRLAKKVQEKFTLGVDDHDTPLAEVEGTYAERTARAMQKNFKLPHVIFVSPYTRTVRTFEIFKKYWPELATVKVYEDERIRERDHGLAILYNDWKVFFALHPEQRRLYELHGKYAAYRYTYPQGENMLMVRQRNRSFIDTVIREFSGQSLWVFTHHENILAIRANQERWNDDEYIRVDTEEKPVNCGVTVYRGDPIRGKDGKLVLDVYNKQYY